MFYEDVPIYESVERIVPGEIQRHEMRHYIIVICYGRPGSRTDPDWGCAAKIADIHNLAAKRRTWTLKVDHASNVLQFSRRLLTDLVWNITRLDICQRPIKIGPDF